MTKTVEEVFEDIKGRQAGLIKALTTDINEFYQPCDPEKENLCLYGLPDGTWEVDLPVEDMPPELPEPTLGINFARDGTLEPDWLALVAIHSNSWLISLAFYFGARFGFEKNERHQLFEMINELPTVFEVVWEADKKSRDNDMSELAVTITPLTNFGSAVVSVSYGSTASTSAPTAVTRGIGSNLWSSCRYYLWKLEQRI